MAQQSMTNPENLHAAFLYDVAVAALAALRQADTEAALNAPTPRADVPLPIRLALTQEDMDQVTRIIDICRNGPEVPMAEFLDVLAGIAGAENPRETALFHLQEYYDLLIRSVAYRVMAHERGGRDHVQLYR